LTTVTTPEVRPFSLLQHVPSIYKPSISIQAVRTEKLTIHRSMSVLNTAATTLVTHFTPWEICEVFKTARTRTTQVWSVGANGLEAQATSISFIFSTHFEFMVE
jgi:hypothetical protein